ncbi:MAG TPA: hypothetical protein VFC78_14055 [Tepidisphaeraceae bacterium]|nr:hypothetical protein [Tepidisphaeraceae bacterium]
MKVSLSRSILRFVICFGGAAALGVGYYSVRRRSFGRENGAVREHVGWNAPELIEQNLAADSAAFASYERIQPSASQPPWALFHGFLGHIGNYEIIKNGSAYSAEEWLLRESSWERAYGRREIMVQREYGLSFAHAPSPAMVRQYEDHYCQFLYMLSETGMDPAHVILHVPPAGRSSLLSSMVADEQRFCHGLLDVSWALPVFIRWGHPTWKNRFGEDFDLDRLLRQHLDREDRCVACFGTHWRMGLAIAVREGGAEISGETMRRARGRLREAIQEAKASQDTASGQFRLEWGVFPKRPANAGNLPALPTDDGALISHQGHMLEWLMVALSDQELASEKWPRQAAHSLLEKLKNLPADMNYGGYSHAVHALRLYRKRMENR